MWTYVHAKKADRKAQAEQRERDAELRKTVRELEAETQKLHAERSALDRAMFDPAGAEPRYAKLAMSDLAIRRAAVSERLEAAEARWLEASEALEMAAA